MNSNKSEEDITCFPSLTKKLKVKNIFCVQVWILLKYQPYHQLGPVIQRHSTKSHPICFQGLCLKKGRVLLGNSMLLDDDSFSAWWIFESTNQKTLWWSNSSCHHLFSRFNNLKACCESSVIFSGLCCHAFDLLFFLKHYVETKEKKLALSCTGQLQKLVKNVPCQWCLFVRSEFSQRVQRSSLQHKYCSNLP